MNTSSVIDATEQLVQRELRKSAPPRPEPPRGIYLQLYRGGIRGPTPQAKRDILKRFVDQIAQMRLPDVVFHGFCEDLASNWDGLARIAHDRGLLALASWGLDSKDLTAARKGQLVGNMLARSTCAAGLLDAESQWDSDLGAANDMDEPGRARSSRPSRSARWAPSWATSPGSPSRPTATCAGHRRAPTWAACSAGSPSTSSPRSAPGGGSVRRTSTGLWRALPPHLRADGPRVGRHHPGPARGGARATAAGHAPGPTAGCCTSRSTRSWGAASRPMRQ